MKSFYQARALARLNGRRNIPSTQPFTTSSLFYGRAIEIPISKATNDRDSFPTIPTCPDPTCACSEMPTGLEIDHKKPLRGLMPRYARHIVIRTGQEDWESRIEDGSIGKGVPEEGKGSNLARELKELIGPKGKYYNNANFLITNSSFDSWSRTRGRSVTIYPEGYTVCDVGDTPDGLESFVEQFLVSSKDGEKDLRSPKQEFTVREPTEEPTILVCGHNSRDQRCGVLGPLLRDEFMAWMYRQRREYRERKSAETTDSIPEAEPNPNEERRRVSESFDQLKRDWVRLYCSMKVGLISHIGGHAFAGNVIIYLPANHCLADGSLSPLAGKGIWYGRVKPRHVEGIMEETVRKGRVIENLLRGVHGDVDIV